MPKSTKSHRRGASLVRSGSPIIAQKQFLSEKAKPTNPDTALQRMFKKHRKEFQQIFKKNLANFWNGPELGLSATRFIDALMKDVEVKDFPETVRTRFGQRGLEILRDLLGIKEEP